MVEDYLSEARVDWKVVCQMPVAALHRRWSGREREGARSGVHVDARADGEEEPAAIGCGSLGEEEAAVVVA